jgi:bacillolysin
VRTTLCVIGASTATLTLVTPGLVPASAGAHAVAVPGAARAGVSPGVSSASGALARLTADARGAVRVSRGADGFARVVGVTGAHDPRVTRTMPVRDAARAHVSRYGALLGVGDRGTRLVAGPVARTVTGDRVVRFSESRNGLPVIGGAVAVDLRPDRQLGSLTASVSRATVPEATFSAGVRHSPSRPSGSTQRVAVRC